MPSLSESLLDLIGASPLSLKEIAAKAEVPYQPLRRWVKGERGNRQGRIVRSYDVRSADAVYSVLAGKPFVEGGEG